MQFEPDTDIRKRADGSIDTDFYIERGRLARATQARDLTKALFGIGRSKGDGITASSVLRKPFPWIRQAT